MKYAVLMMLCFSLFSCFEPDTTLTSEDWQYIDSLYNEDASRIRREADSICNLRKGELFDSMVDSIKQEYIKEIESIIK